MKSHIVETDKAPHSLIINQIDDIELVDLAREEVENILKTILKGQIASNQHCYINLPHPLTVENYREAFVPIFDWGSPEVKNIETLFSVALKLVGLEKNLSDLKDRANVIVREYKPGQYIPFHFDELECTSEVCGIILLNEDPECRGLCFQKGDKKNDTLNYTVLEKAGSVFVFSDEARYSWKHGLPPVRGRRISITCRFYKQEVINKWKKDMNIAMLEKDRIVIKYNDINEKEKEEKEKITITICDFQNQKKSKPIVVNNDISLEELTKIFKNKLSLKVKSISFNDGTLIENGTIFKQGDVLIGRK
jgi:hypothetical protein